MIQTRCNFIPNARGNAGLQLMLKTEINAVMNTDEAAAHRNAVQEALRRTLTAKELGKARDLKRLKRHVLNSLTKLDKDLANQPWDAYRASDEDDLTDPESMAN